MEQASRCADIVRIYHWWRPLPLRVRRGKKCLHASRWQIDRPQRKEKRSFLRAERLRACCRQVHLVDGVGLRARRFCSLQ